MIPAHTQLYSELSSIQALYLWRELHREGLVADPPDPSSASGPRVAELCQGLSHAQVVLSIASRSDKIFYDIAQALLRRPIYMCARGETGLPIYDVLGRPLPLPLGHRRGEPPGSGRPPPAVRKRTQYQRRSDPRVITQIVQPNPKQPGSKSWHRYTLYREGMTVNEYITLGGLRDDINYDAMKGFIRIDLP